MRRICANCGNPPETTGAPRHTTKVPAAQPSPVHATGQPHDDAPESDRRAARHVGKHPTDTPPTKTTARGLGGHGRSGETSSR